MFLHNRHVIELMLDSVDASVAAQARQALHRHFFHASHLPPPETSPEAASCASPPLRRLRLEALGHLRISGVDSAVTERVTRAERLLVAKDACNLKQISRVQLPPKTGVLPLQRAHQMLLDQEISAAQFAHVRSALVLRRAQMLKREHERTSSEVRPFITPRPPPGYFDKSDKLHASGSLASALHTSPSSSSHPPPLSVGLPVLPMAASLPSHALLRACQEQLKLVFDTSAQAAVFFDHTGRGSLSATDLRIAWTRLRVYLFDQPPAYQYMLDLLAGGGLREAKGTEFVGVERFIKMLTWHAVPDAVAEVNKLRQQQRHSFMTRISPLINARPYRSSATVLEGGEGMGRGETGPDAKKAAEEELEFAERTYDKNVLAYRQKYAADEQLRGFQEVLKVYFSNAGAAFAFFDAHSRGRITGKDVQRGLDKMNLFQVPAENIITALLLCSSDGRTTHVSHRTLEAPCNAGAWTGGEVEGVTFHQFLAAVAWLSVSREEADRELEAARKERHRIAGSVVKLASLLTPRALSKQERKAMHDTVVAWEQNKSTPLHHIPHSPGKSVTSSIVTTSVDEVTLQTRIKARKHSVNTHVGLLQRKLQALFADVVDAYVFFNPNGDHGISEQELRRGLRLVAESEAGVEVYTHTHIHTQTNTHTHTHTHTRTHVYIYIYTYVIYHHILMNICICTCTCICT